MALQSLPSQHLQRTGSCCKHQSRSFLKSGGVLTSRIMQRHLGAETHRGLKPMCSAVRSPSAGLVRCSHRQPMAIPACTPQYSRGLSASRFTPPRCKTNDRRMTRIRTMSSAVEVVDAQQVSEVTAFDEFAAGKERKYIMISGKGGVGKTSLAASLALKLAAAGHPTLVVSTDPAHSLSDSLAQDVSGGSPVPIEGTELPIWGMEIDPAAAQADLRAKSAKDDGAGVSNFLGGMGLGMLADQLKDLKLGELLDTAPPGLDEAVAIAKVVEFVNGEDYAKYTRIVFDTAPTGHTLRLLAVPDFVNASLGKIVRIRQRLASAGSALRGLFGASEQQDEALQKLEKLQSSVAMVRDLFRDEKQTQFVIATIATTLGMNESSRLAGALRREHVPCRRIIVNQVLTESMGEKWMAMKLKDQSAALRMVMSDPGLKDLNQLRGPLLDLEVRGPAALEYFGRQLWGSSFEAMAASQERRYVMVGGKGGVGKTTSSASLAVRFAEEGHTTLVVSTDPAHSLSDALDQDVSGGSPVAVEGVEWPLYGMEVDVEKAREEIKAMASATDGDGTSKAAAFMSSVGLGAFADQLKDLRLSELLDTLPPGIDEVVAISKVVAFLKDPKYSKFTRVVFDTAPTGHTLRLLTLPDFLDATIGKVVRLRAKLTSAGSAIKGAFGIKSEKDPAVVKLEQLQGRMEEAKELFRNKETTEFVIVSIPTVMAAAESGRLAKALLNEGIPVKSLAINQIMNETAGSKFLAAKRTDQQRALRQLETDPELSRLGVTQAPLVDMEVRGVPGLQYFGNVAWKSATDGQSHQ